MSAEQRDKAWENYRHWGGFSGSGERHAFRASWDAHATTMPDRKAIYRALGAVLVNAHNFPEKLAIRMLGQDMNPVIEQCTDAVLALLNKEEK